MTLLTRRALTTAALAGTFLPGFARAQSRKPIVIGHRGCSGERPEHTVLAYERAIEQGADFIEPDLVPTKDGHLVARHENEIGGTTDVASRPEFAARKATKTIDGQSVTGWFTEDFTLAELKTLRARERLPQLRPANTAYDGQAQLLTFEEVVAIARAGSQRTGRTIGVYPELKHPTYFASIGLPTEDRLVAKLKALDLNSATAPVFVQCFEVGPLKRLRAKTPARLVFLVAGEGGPADLPTVKYADLVTAQGLKDVAVYADGLGPEKTMVVPQDANALLPATDLVKNAHAAGLVVHPWTVRAENYFLPATLRKGDPKDPAFLAQHGDAIAVLKALYAAGVDGVFSDFPALAVAARG
ncbi:glycerophosphodiester phosphodiesterase [Caulobacter segnis]|uniref:glycerophosphodiester phosphodiesterase n=2 Tax=Caulobacter segnis TaxID=88688 RepID=D5VEM1_CAUST|nr:glycerophosphodiester phosphodiesterase [Caulobacter segnis]ADG09164.1 glycerophosphoryl diester phosphodiesterase [Caulobacter segnis ATCC 21756]AVQ00980.1 glycerophosphodiester phosphodiesterase [Caulobacter segnis]